jgi:hypothetical protein
MGLSYALESDSSLPAFIAVMTSSHRTTAVPLVATGFLTFLLYLYLFGGKKNRPVLPSEILPNVMMERISLLLLIQKTPLKSRPGDQIS